MREQFEKLPEITEKIDCLKFENGFYYSVHHDCECEESFVNGAWYAFQEQQKVISGMLECMDDAIRLIDEGNSWDAKELLK